MSQTYCLWQRLNSFAGSCMWEEVRFVYRFIMFYILKYHLKGIEFLPQTLISYLYFFVTQCRTPLKYQWFAPSGCIDIGI